MKVGTHKVEVYDTIEDMPIVRYTKFNKYLLIDAGIGSDLNDFDLHFQKISKFISQDKKKECYQELLNLRQSFSNIIQELSPKYLAFATLIKSVDGKPCNDLSDDGLIKVIEKIGDVPNSKIVSLVDSIQKKNR